MTAVENYRDILCLLRDLLKKVRNFDIKDASKVFGIAFVIVDEENELKHFRLYAVVTRRAAWLDQSTVS